MVLIWDGSFIGDITEDIVHHRNVNYIRHCAGFSNIDMTFTKISIEKITNELWADLCLDVLKGIFYLPSSGFHICLIRTTMVDKEDGSEITTRAKYCIRPLEHPIVSLSSQTNIPGVSIDKDLVKRLFAFAWIMGVKETLTEDIIEFRKINIDSMKPGAEALIPGLKWGVLGAFAPGTTVPTVSDLVLRNWFGSSDSPGLSDEENFYSYIREFVKPYRSATALKFRLDKILSIYFPDRKEENDKWMNEVFNLTDKFFRTEVQEPKAPETVGTVVLKPSAPGTVGTVVLKPSAPGTVGTVVLKPSAPGAIKHEVLKPSAPGAIKHEVLKPLPTPRKTAIKPFGTTVLKPLAPGTTVLKPFGLEKIKEPSKQEKVKVTRAARLLPLPII